MLVSNHSPTRLHRSSSGGLVIRINAALAHLLGLEPRTARLQNNCSTTKPSDPLIISDNFLIFAWAASPEWKSSPRQWHELHMQLPRIMCWCIMHVIAEYISRMQITLISSFAFHPISVSLCKQFHGFIKWQKGISRPTLRLKDCSDLYGAKIWIKRFSFC